MTDNAEATTTVAVDAMGGDFGPSVVVPGVVEALNGKTAFRAALYGDPAAIEDELSHLAFADAALEIVPCTQRIEMGESPATAIRNRPDAPIPRALHDHRTGGVQAVVSAGSTGAMVAGSLMLLGRLASVDRPAIATVIPTLQGRFMLLDVGANVQCTPEHLVCFARMGERYSRVFFDLEAPTVGLLNIGEEPGKGNELCVEANRRLSAITDIDFRGNVESRRLLLDPLDVVVTDGFTGNVVLKLIEGFGVFLHKAAGASGGEGSSHSILGDLLQRMDYSAYGGALLLGVKGTSVIAHGSSSPRAITNAVLNAARLAALSMPAKLEAFLTECD